VVAIGTKRTYGDDLVLVRFRGPVHSEHQDELACGCGWPVVFLISARRVFSGCKMSIDPVVFWVSRDIFGA